MHVSYMAVEICNGATKADWNVQSYRRYWKLLNQESEWLNGIYAELKDVNLTPHTWSVLKTT
jgi:hypothetical protein